MAIVLPLGGGDESAWEEILHAVVPGATGGIYFYWKHAERGGQRAEYRRLSPLPHRRPSARTQFAEKGDQNAVTPWSRVWIVEDRTPEDWLPADEGFLEMPRPKKPAAKPAAGPKMVTAAAKPKAVVPKTTKKPGAATTPHPAKGATTRPATVGKNGPTTKAPARKTRSIESVSGTLPLGRRLLSLTLSPQVR
ncbi:putative ubiquitin carboxyl-terminal hydrolase MINDY-4 [Frankliniella fusca]|uniref:Ubiquitin carboxyl-terminal hydrolase MINDY-4 n=1 Tax=Frankliniella fusca TaxID=407009 RepID=A0AAE1HVI3_9NEOP|nr:putative ubiquitin carboxyl-terminal hydrolase MINDY-4 [Frankliniella fusca]